MVVRRLDDVCRFLESHPNTTLTVSLTDGLRLLLTEMKRILGCMREGLDSEEPLTGKRELCFRDGPRMRFARIRIDETEIIVLPSALRLMFLNSKNPAIERFARDRRET